MLTVYCNVKGKPYALYVDFELRGSVLLPETVMLAQDSCATQGCRVLQPFFYIYTGCHVAENGKPAAEPN